MDGNRFSLHLGLVIVLGMSGCSGMSPYSAPPSHPFFMPTAEDAPRLASLAHELDRKALQCAEATNCEQVSFARGMLSLFENREAARASFRHVIEHNQASSLAQSSQLWLQVIESNQDANPLTEITAQFVRDWMELQLRERADQMSIASPPLQDLPRPRADPACARAAAALRRAEQITVGVLHQVAAAQQEVLARSIELWKADRLGETNVAAWLAMAGGTKDMFGANTFTSMGFEIRMTPVIVALALTTAQATETHAPAPHGAPAAHADEHEHGSELAQVKGAVDAILNANLRYMRTHAPGYFQRFADKQTPRATVVGPIPDADAADPHRGATDGRSALAGAELFPRAAVTLRRGGRRAGVGRRFG